MIFDANVAVACEFKMKLSKFDYGDRLEIDGNSIYLLCGHEVTHTKIRVSNTRIVYEHELYSTCMPKHIDIILYNRCNSSGLENSQHNIYRQHCGKENWFRKFHLLSVQRYKLHICIRLKVPMISILILIIFSVFIYFTYFNEYLKYTNK